jgi:hypothetical protein
MIEFDNLEAEDPAYFVNHFLAGPTSILPPSQQLATAQSAFNAALSAAMGGNRDALTGLTTQAQDVIDATRRYYGSSQAGATIIQQLLGTLQGLPGVQREKEAELLRALAPTEASIAENCAPSRRRKPRQPTLASVAKRASKAGIEIARYELKPDGTIVIVAGKSESTEPNPWLDDLRRKEDKR